MPGVTACASLGYAAWFLRAARELGVGIVSFPFGPRVFGGDWAAEMTASARTYRRIADLAAEHGIVLNLEMPHLYQRTDSLEQECRRCIREAAAGGGYILAAGDMLPTETSPEKIHAMVDMASRLGRY